MANILAIPNLLCYWDFGSKEPFVAKGRHQYRLLKGNGDPRITAQADNGIKYLQIREREYLNIPRHLCPGLNLHGKDAAVTVIAWVKRETKSFDQCEAIAGVWNESFKKRQYCLFLNIKLHASANQVCGHISGVGGPTPGEKYCIDVSIGKTPLPFGEWHYVGFSYDSRQIRSYLDGNPDLSEGRNPYLYDQGIFDGGTDGADFTVGAVDRHDEMGNYFVGGIRGIAIFDRALTDAEIAALRSPE